MSLRNLSISQLSEITGKDPKTIKKRIDGLQEESIEGRAILYDAQKALALIYATSTVDKLEKQLLEFEVDTEKYKSKKAELDFKERQKELVDVTKISQIVEREYTQVRAALFAIPNKMAHALINIETPAEIKAKLEDAVNEALTELTTQTLKELEEDLAKNKNGEHSEDIKTNSPEGSKAQVQT
jgi:DNA-binding Lrp family transcriptional regulator